MYREEWRGLMLSALRTLSRRLGLGVCKLLESGFSHGARARSLFLITTALLFAARLAIDQRL